MRIGVVDIGTNTVRMLVADVAEGRVMTVDRAVEIVGLGTGMDRSGVISAESLDRADAVLRGYRASIEAADVDRVRVVATSATRDAANRAEVLERISGVLGVTAEAISGVEEAHLSFAGALSGVPHAGTTLVIDPGGGSTEFVWGLDSPLEAVSVDIGSVRLTERLDAGLPAPGAAVEAGRGLVRGMLDDQVHLPPIDTVIGVAGTFTSLAAIVLGLERYDPDRVHGSVVALRDLDRLTDRFAGLTLAQTAAIPSLDPKRAPVILAGSIIVAEAVRYSRLAEVVASETDLLEGAALAFSSG